MTQNSSRDRDRKVKSTGTGDSESMTARTSDFDARTRSLAGSGSPIALRQRISAQDTSKPLTRTDILDRELLRAIRLASEGH